MNSRRVIQSACGAAMMLPLAGCISVSPPDKPIEINLNVTIQQEVLVRLQRDVEQTDEAIRSIEAIGECQIEGRVRHFCCSDS